MCVCGRGGGVSQQGLSMDELSQNIFLKRGVKRAQDEEDCTVILLVQPLTIILAKDLSCKSEMRRIALLSWKILQCKTIDSDSRI